MIGGDDDDDLDLDLDLDNPKTPTAVAPEEDDEEQVAPEPPIEGKAEAEDEDDDDLPVRPLTRGEKRFAKLKDEIRRRDAEMAEIKAKYQELAQRAPAPQQEDPELERRRLEMMTPEERMEYRLSKSEQMHQMQLRRLEMQNWDMNDKSAFNALSQNDPRAKKLAEKVEQIYQEQSRKGTPVPREMIYHHELGRLVAAQAPKARAKAQSEGAERLRRQTTTAGSGKGDVSANRGKGRTFEDQFGDALI